MPLLIRARGKDSIVLVFVLVLVLVLVVRVLRHFRVGFSVLHASDGPNSSKGEPSNEWKAPTFLTKELKPLVEDYVKRTADSSKKFDFSLNRDNEMHNKGSKTNSRSHDGQEALSFRDLPR